MIDIVKVKKNVRSDTSEKSVISKKQRSEMYHKYQRYIRSGKFAEVKKIVKERDQCCQFCGRTESDIEGTKISFNCHHIRYDNLFEGGEKEAADCRLYCSVCHRAGHRASSNYSRFALKEKKDK